MGNTQSGTHPGRAATRAVALVGPAGTGKTSLAEALLFASGAINRQGSVEAGSTVGDASPEARARGGSTELGMMHFDYLGDRFAVWLYLAGVSVPERGLPSGWYLVALLARVAAVIWLAVAVWRMAWRRCNRPTWRWS